MKIQKKVFPYKYALVILNTSLLKIKVHIFFIQKTKWRPSQLSNWISIIPQIFSFFQYLSVFFWFHWRGGPSTWDIPMPWAYLALWKYRK